MDKSGNQTTPPNEIIFYETEDGKISIAVRFEHENIWLTQKHMADLFECTTDNISLHLKNIYSSGELTKDSTTEEYSTVQQEGKRSVTRKALFYNLEAVIAVGYRVNTGRGIAFRSWATDKLDAFLKFNEQEILEGLGKVSHEVAKALAHKEYEKYRVIQDSNYKSDFDKLVENAQSISLHT